MLMDPMYRPSSTDLDLLQADVCADVLRQTRLLTPHQRRAMSDRLAIEAALAVLRQLEPRHSVADANTVRRNQPGFDFLVDGGIKVQVKGATYVEGFGWAVKSEKALDFDVLIYVDIGVVINGNVGRLSSAAIPVKPYADYYIVPINIVKELLNKRRAINGRGNNLYLWKRLLNPNTAEYRGQAVELLEWLGRFDVIDQLLS